jgi:hypothetical protein
MKSTKLPASHVSAPAKRQPMKQSAPKTKRAKY